MAKLAHHSELTNMIKFPGDISEINTSIDSALEVATSNLENDLRVGSFTRETRFDIFTVKGNDPIPGLFEYHWLLSRGFVDCSQALTVRIADELSDFGTSNETDITSDTIIDFVKGTVSVFGGEITDIRIPKSTTKLVGKFVRIDYTSGFNEDDDDGFFDADEIPSWLKSAALLNSILVMDTIDPNLRAYGDSKIDTKKLSGTYYRSIEGHIRYHPKYQIPSVKS